MLRYLGLGTRHFGDRPMPAHKRVNWEFMAVVSGKIAPLLGDARQAVPVADTFWLFPPATAHGWIGLPGEKSELIVIHFNAVPNVIARIADERGHLVTRLSVAERNTLQALARKLKRHYWHPVLGSELHTERALIDLCLLVSRDHTELLKPLEAGKAYARVTAAEKWLHDHLSQNPSIREAAQHSGLSVSQLNRLFREVRKESPQDVLNRIKIERAMELLGGSGAKLHAVAAECGFSSASNLCRAFKRLKGHSPTTWRRETFIQYKAPTSDGVVDHTQFGRRQRPAN